MTLIAISVFIGYLLERTYTSLSKHIINWSRLLLIVGALYVAIGCTLVILHTKTEGAEELAALSNVNKLFQCLNVIFDAFSPEHPLPLPLEEVNQTFAAALSIWRNEKTPPLSPIAAIRLNAKLWTYNHDLRGCAAVNKNPLPTNYSLDGLLGKGDKIRDEDMPIITHSCVTEVNN